MFQLERKEKMYIIFLRNFNLLAHVQLYFFLKLTKNFYLFINEFEFQSTFSHYYQIFSPMM